MRRALVIAGVMLAGLLALAPGLATAAPPPPEEEIVEEKEDVIFTLLVEGFTVTVFAEDNDGDQTAALSVSREGLTSAYRVPATITDDSVAAFTWNLKAGTAHVDPPAPFTGGATFERRPGGHSAWRGSLRAPLLGGQPFRLAGEDFRAQLIEGSPLD